MHVTVPETPDGVRSRDARRLLLTGLDPTARGGYATQGPRLYPGDTIDLPDGALILCVDKTITGTARGFRGHGVHDTFDAQVSVHLVTDDGLEAVWARHFKDAKSAYGATALKKFAALLEQHPPAVTEPVMVEEKCRPNRKDGACRWCGDQVRAQFGHWVEGETVEHWQRCPSTYAVGGPCADCGKPVKGGQGMRYIVRDGIGWVEHRHQTRSCEPVADLPVLRAPAIRPHPSGAAEPLQRRCRNGVAAECHWCGQRVAVDQGWRVGWHEDAYIEHDRCPGTGTGKGEVCALCGVDIVLGQGAYYPHRDNGRGGLRAEHLPEMLCTVVPAPSAAAQEAAFAERVAREREEAARQAELRRAEDERKERRRRKDRECRQAKAQAARAQDRRLSAQGTEVSRASECIMSKNIGHGRRAQLWEHTLTLDNGHVTRRWNVEVVGTDPGFNGEDYDPDPGETYEETDDKDAARATYSTLQAPTRRRDRYTRRWVEAPARGDRPCPPGRHCGNCAAPVPEGTGMVASLGLACDVDCYDAMADDHGDHDRRYHHRP